MRPSGAPSLERLSCAIRLRACTSACPCAHFARLTTPSTDRHPAWRNAGRELIPDPDSQARTPIQVLFMGLRSTSGGAGKGEPSHRGLPLRGRIPGGPRRGSCCPRPPPCATVPSQGWLVGGGPPAATMVAAPWKAPPAKGPPLRGACPPLFAAGAQAPRGVAAGAPAAQARPWRELRCSPRSPAGRRPPRRGTKRHKSAGDA